MDISISLNRLKILKHLRTKAANLEPKNCISTERIDTIYMKYADKYDNLEESIIYKIRKV